MAHRFEHSQFHDVRGKITIFRATEVLGASTLAAVQDANEWLAGLDQVDQQPIDQQVVDQNSQQDAVEPTGEGAAGPTGGTQ